MCIALGATGYWLYLDVAGTPNAVVACVIIFNAAFGYRWVALTRLGGRVHAECLRSWGPIPWLYPPEVRCEQWQVDKILTTA